MGDYSRDTFKLTNVLHQLLSGEAVINPRHYVAVRMQQGVPLLDADWNDADDIRRREIELLLRDVIGNGVPGLGSGFAIEPVENDNNFAIMPGTLLVDGWQVINPAVFLYVDLLRLNGGGTDLTTPGGSRTDIVYLDVFEREITAYTETVNDERLINEFIGVETTARNERSWTVWVAEGVSDFSSLSLTEAGHKYYPLARLRRNGSARIEGFMIEDLRRLGLTLADGLKAPMYVRRGTAELNAERFSQMLIDLRSVIKLWQQNELFPIVLGGTESWLSYQNAANEIYYLTTSAEVSSDTHNLDNSDGLTIMQKLVDAQHGLLDVVTNFGSGVPAEMAIVDLYADYLDGDGGSISGIQPAIDDDDLLAAVIAQEQLLEFLGLSTGELPQGSVNVMLASVIPATAITTGAFQITYTVISDLLVPATAEDFNLEAVVSDVRWAVSLNTAQLTLLPGESQDVVMTVNPDDTLLGGDFADINLVARAQRRPSIQSGQPAQRFTIGALPPGETFLFYSGAAVLQDSTLVLQPADVESTTYEVSFTLVNTSGGTELHTFDVEYELVWPSTLPAGVVPTNWIPSAAITFIDQDVPGSDALVTFPIEAPALSGVTENIEFTLTATATLTDVDGSPIASGKSVTIELPVRIQIV
jgi:hypothetical protein